MTADIASQDRIDVPAASALRIEAFARANGIESYFDRALEAGSTRGGMVRFWSDRWFIAVLRAVDDVVHAHFFFIHDAHMKKLGEVFLKVPQEVLESAYALGDAKAVHELVREAIPPFDPKTEKLMKLFG